MELARAGGIERDLSNATNNKLTISNERSEQKKSNYGYLKHHFNVTKFILQSGMKDSL